MEDITSLIHEVDHLVTNPNQNALKSFHCFLQNENISHAELAIWALAKPCQIVQLATIVVENSTDDSVFKSLARLPEFVNAVSKSRPFWLESLLDKTTPSAQGTSLPGHPVDCAAFILSSASKDGALPASNMQLISKAAMSVIECPNELNLRRLSELCSAIQSNILNCFTEESLTALSSQCKKVFSGSIGTNSDIEIMLAQDILAQVATAFQTLQTPSKSSLETPPGAKFSEGCRKRVFKLFSGSNASTTFKITVLRLSMFCSEERGSSSLVALEGIRLAQRIIAPMIVSARRQWVEQHSRLIEKFVSRLGREALDLDIRLEGVVFCILLLGAENEVLPSLKKVASAVLVAFCDSKPSYSAVATGHDKVITHIVACLWPSKASPDRMASGKCAVLTRMVSFIVEQCQPWSTNTVSSVLKLHRAKIVLDSLNAALSRSSLSLCIIDFIQLSYVPEWWDSELTFPLLAHEGDSGNCIGEEVCSKSVDRLRFEVARNFSSLLLTAAWHSSRALQNPETCQRLLNQLKGSSSRVPDLRCSYSAERIMGLEDTGALTEAQAGCEALRHRLENETALRTTLESRLAQSEELLEEERQASSALQQYLEGAERECSGTAKALQSAREDYVELLHDADRKVQATESKWRHDELLLRADYLRRELELEDQVHEMRFVLKRKDDELEREKVNRAALEEDMRAAVAGSRQQIEELRLAVAEKEKALEEAESLRTRLMALLGGKT